MQIFDTQYREIIPFSAAGYNGEFYRTWANEQDDVVWYIRGEIAEKHGLVNKPYYTFEGAEFDILKIEENNA